MLRKTKRGNQDVEPILIIVTQGARFIPSINLKLMRSVETFPADEDHMSCQTYLVEINEEKALFDLQIVGLWV